MYKVTVCVHMGGLDMYCKSTTRWACSHSPNYTFAWINACTITSNSYMEVHTIAGKHSPKEGHQLSKVLGKLFDWCLSMATLQTPHANLRDCEDRSRSRPLRRKWLGVLPWPPPGGSSLVGNTPLPPLTISVRCCLSILI